MSRSDYLEVQENSPRQIWCTPGRLCRKNQTVIHGYSQFLPSPPRSLFRGFFLKAGTPFRFHHNPSSKPSRRNWTDFPKCLPESLPKKFSTILAIDHQRLKLKSPVNHSTTLSTATPCISTHIHRDSLKSLDKMTICRKILRQVDNFHFFCWPQIERWSFGEKWRKFVEGITFAISNIHYLHDDKQ